MVRLVRGEPAFVQVRAHAATPAAASPDGRVVLSRLARGECRIGRPGLSVKFLLAGEERYELDGRPWLLRAGQLMVADDGPDSRVTFPGREETRGLCLYLPLEGGTTVPAHPDILDGPPLLVPAGTTGLGRLADRAARCLAERPSLGPALAGPLLAAARRGLARLLLDRGQALDRLTATKAATRREILRRLDLARAHLHETPGRPVPLAELARVAGMSQFHLARCFTEAIGSPPAAYHRDLRLAAAARALRRDRRPAAEVAGLFGFPDPASFSRAFRRRYGLPPGAYAAGN